MSINKSLTEKEAAEELNLAVQTLRNWRHQRRGPNYQKYGRAIRYELSELNEYRERNRVTLSDHMS